MRTLALMEQGLILDVEGELFHLERQGKRVETVRAAEVSEVQIFGGITLTPAAIAVLLARGVDVVFLSARGRYRGRLVGRLSKNVELRIRQFSRLTDPEFTLRLARGIVAGKIANQRNLLLRAQREHRREDLAETIGGMRQMFAEAERAASLESLRGLEGQAASLYFRSLGRCLRNPAFRFERRTRRPPKDPVNAVLSFGYTLLGATMESIVLRVGLDPMLGAFHQADYGRPSLMLDLIEEFRPVIVDALMLRLINRRELAPEDFEAGFDEVDAIWAGGTDETPESEQARGIWLSETGRRVFFRAWGRRLRETVFYPPREQRLTLEEIMEQQVYHFARVLRGEEPAYRPFVPR
ncbi:MAG TPA: CRISPR-associated endonuclease Cas1 [Vicinamibacterales bacterium]|nr:CRISPR-associated endonuclease Cas1 [Vicinamibacterales bacterium]